jgi:hypothetical protein
MPRLALLVVLALAGCKGRSAPDFTASPASSPPRTSSIAGVDAKTEAAPLADEDRVAREAAPRGLGTQFGEERSSAVVDAPFTRASSSPDALLSLFYNDLDGVRATAGRLGARGSLESRMITGDGLLAITLIDDNGRSLPAADIDGRRYVIGNQGQAYRIGVENHSRDRFEVVGSVDGLDVIDGDTAALHKRGYIVEPFSSLVIDGWRTSSDTVAAFRFAEIEDSYADRTGKPRDIGVIGVAFFGEQNAPGFDDPRRRHAADPFPGRFAAPPRR